MHIKNPQVSHTAHLFLPLSHLFYRSLSTFFLYRFGSQLSPGAASHFRAYNMYSVNHGNNTHSTPPKTLAAFLAPTLIATNRSQLGNFRHVSVTTRPKHTPLTTRATLQPNECSWRSERDLRAIESEFYVSFRHSTQAVDEDMHRLRRRISVLGKREKHWANICQQFVSLSIITGIPMIDTDSGEPTTTAWLCLSLSTLVPLYLLSIIVSWLQTVSPVLSSSPL